MILYIDTSKPETKIALFENGRVLAEKVWLSVKNQSEELLSEINKIILKENKTKSDIFKIVVVTGPGSYTGLRVGLSTANALAFCLNIAIEGVSSDESKGLEQLNNSKKLNHFERWVVPKYLYEPQITKPKPRR